MSEGNNSQNNESNSSNSMPHRLKWKQIVTISIPVIAALIAAYATYNSFVLVITREVTSLTEKVDTLQNANDKIQIQIEKSLED